MLLDLNNPKHRRILLMLVVSTIAYSISSVFAYLVAVRLPIPITILSIQVGFLACTLIFWRLSRDRADPRPSKSNIAVWVYGISFAITGVFLFYSYKSYSLANIFPLLEGGILVFLALDFMFHRKVLAGNRILVLAGGVGVVFLGTYLAESTRLAFNLSTLPYAVGIILFSGIGYYALANKTGKIKEESKNLAFSVAAIASALVLLCLYHGSALFASVQAIPFAAGIISGFFLCIAFSMEMRAVKHSMTGSERRNVFLRNFINNFTELDTVVVLIASVLIGSYTYNGLFGGALIVIGVLVIGFIQ
jgi:drug/metabolite transporter (DMT)-like permease